MAKKVIWSKQALKDRREILQYWIERNSSKIYSVKLNNLFVDAFQLIASHPNIGVQTDFENVRGKSVKDYYIFYEVEEFTINILTIWDCRQNPGKLKGKIIK